GKARRIGLDANAEGGAPAIDAQFRADGRRRGMKPEFLIPAGSVRMFGVDQAAKLLRHPRAMTGRRRRGPHGFRHDQAVTARSSAGRDAAHFSASDRRMTVFLPSFFALMRPRFTSS